MKDYGQEGAFALWDELSPEDRELLVRDIESLDLSRIDRIIRRSLGSQGYLLSHSLAPFLGYPLEAGISGLVYGGMSAFGASGQHASAAIKPVSESSVSRVEERSPEDKERWWRRGLKAIVEGKLAVVLLPGGQGTRLGSSDPKGCFNIGLPSGKSLFQLQAERILCVQKLAAQSSDTPGNTLPIPWYIMTNPFTDDVTRKFFESCKYFGLQNDQVTFFQQGTLPCVSADCRFIMETRYKVAKAPDGNGGVYSALKSIKLLEDMAARGVKYVDCYGVDNALVRVADQRSEGTS